MAKRICEQCGENLGSNPEECSECVWYLTDKEDQLREREYDRREDAAVDEWRGA